MKILIITQRVDVNDDNLGFFHRWLEKLAEKTAELQVACLYEGEHRLPQNAAVFSLGKERGYSKIRQFFRLQGFLLKHLPEADGVLIHMCPIYAILSFPLIKIFRKRFIMFYAHGGVSLKLRIAEKMADTILTSSLDGCRVKSKKLRVIGQGIDTEFFKYDNLRTANDYLNSPNKSFNILYASRLVPIKDHKTLIEAINILVNQKNIDNIRVKILGRPLLKSQEEYLAGLKNLVKNYNLESYVNFAGGVSFFEMPGQFNWADLFVNPSSTGSLDKAVLEAMASGCLVLNCNEAYGGILADKYMFKKGDEGGLAQKIFNLIRAPKDPNLREIVIKNHKLDNFINKIISEFER